MFKTLTMVKLYLKQELYREALSIAESLIADNESEELLYYKAEALEGLNRNNEAEQILFDLMDKGYIEEHVSILLERIYTKTGKKVLKEEHIPSEEIAAVYEKIGDIDNALAYYEKKTRELKDKIEG